MRFDMRLTNFCVDQRFRNRGYILFKNFCHCYNSAAEKRPAFLTHVYLVRAPVSPKQYDSWLCGGAIVSERFIITSAACVQDVQYLYAIAGYRKYVPDEQIDSDPCTKQKKKKVVYTSTPKSYSFVETKLESWSYIDIALVQVESPYDFKDSSFEALCSYTPAPIPINYESKYQIPGTDAMVLGWGHASVWRQPGDKKNYNQPELHYASILLEDKEVCKRHYSNFKNMSEVIDRYMICSYGRGNILDNGEPLPKLFHASTRCITKQQKAMGVMGILCEEEVGIRNVLTDAFTRKNFYHNNMSDSRRFGICQNDHGGPLVTWIGTREVLIGVASVFQVSAVSQCVGPFLYTSTENNGAFLDCILTMSENSHVTDLERRTLCEGPPSQKGFDTVERYISWAKHPSGPADNEKVLRRPLIPLRGMK